MRERQVKEGFLGMAFQPDHIWVDDDDSPAHCRATSRWSLLAHAWRDQRRGLAAAAAARRPDSPEKDGPGARRGRRSRSRSRIVAPDSPTPTTEHRDGHNGRSGAGKGNGGARHGAANDAGGKGNGGARHGAANDAGGKLSPIGAGDRFSPIQRAGVGGRGVEVCEAELGFASGDGSFDLAGSDPPRLRLARISETSDCGR